MRQLHYQGCVLVRVCVCASVFVSTQGISRDLAHGYLSSPEKKDKKTHFIPNQACFPQVQEEWEHVVLSRLTTMKRSENVKQTEQDRGTYKRNCGAWLSGEKYAMTKYGQFSNP